MYLSRVHIRGFRNLREVSLSLQPGLNAIVGRNNVGKTNLLAALRLCLGAASDRVGPFWLRADDFHRDSRTAEPVGEIRISVMFEQLDEHQVAQFFEIVDFTDNSVAKVHFSARQLPTGRIQQDRWGGPEEGERGPIPSEILAALPVTFLQALRDAEAGLTPGNRNRLASLLEDLSRRQGDSDKATIEEIFAQANDGLEKQALVSTTQSSLRSEVKKMAGSDYSEFSIRAVPPEFSRILRTLHILIEESPVTGLGRNGLGYNNLLYTATVLEHLRKAPSDEHGLLLIEEPEAHLHPQLTVLLGRYLESSTVERVPQAVVTTHSPSFVSNIKPSRVLVLFQSSGGYTRCNSLAKLGLTEKEERQLQRMLDVTRSTLYFAKGLVLVEGISEALLLPELAHLIGLDLAALHISVLPICGVAFETFEKLFQEKGLDIPVALVTDADPPVKSSGDWSTDDPEWDKEASRFTRCERAKKLESLFLGRPCVRVAISQVTLEYDLAAAGSRNPEIMADAWASTFSGAPGTFNRAKLEEAGSELKTRALITWRGICRASHSGSKADFAQVLAERLHQARTSGNPLSFAVPDYLKTALKFVANVVTGGK